MAMVTAPVIASASPVRAASALPAAGTLGTAKPSRAASPSAGSSTLIGFPIAIFVGLFGAVALVAVVASGPRRSPG